MDSRKLLQCNDTNRRHSDRPIIAQTVKCISIGYHFLRVHGRSTKYTLHTNTIRSCNPSISSNLDNHRAFASSTSCYQWVCSAQRCECEIGHSLLPHTIDKQNKFVWIPTTTKNVRFWISRRGVKVESKKRQSKNFPSQFDCQGIMIGIRMCAHTNANRPSTSADRRKLLVCRAQIRISCSVSSFFMCSPWIRHFINAVCDMRVPCGVGTGQISTEAIVEDVSIWIHNDFCLFSHRAAHFV